MKINTFLLRLAVLSEPHQEPLTPREACYIQNTALCDEIKTKAGSETPIDLEP